ncbi:hypothetical protein P0D71_00405 [Paraburkholderia sp. RL17-383-BIF-A]
MRDLLKLWTVTVLVIAGWALLAGALDQVDAHSNRCSVVRCT